MYTNRGAYLIKEAKKQENENSSNRGLYVGTLLELELEDIQGSQATRKKKVI